MRGVGPASFIPAVGSAQHPAQREHACARTSSSSVQVRRDSRSGRCCASTASTRLWSTARTASGRVAPPLRPAASAHRARALAPAGAAHAPVLRTVRGSRRRRRLSRALCHAPSVAARARHDRAARRADAGRAGGSSAPTVRSRRPTSSSRPAATARRCCPTGRVATSSAASSCTPRPIATRRPYVGRDVLVVGAGNTASEISVDLVEGGARRVRLAVQNAAEHRAAPGGRAAVAGRERLRTAPATVAWSTG